MQRNIRCSAKEPSVIHSRHLREHGANLGWLQLCKHSIPEQCRGQEKCRACVHPEPACSGGDAQHHFHMHIEANPSLTHTELLVI